MRAIRGLLIGLAMLLAASSVYAPCASAQYFRFGKNKVHYEDREWFYLQSEHFTVYFYEGGQYLADYTAKAAEEAYGQISRLFQYRIAKPIPLIVYLSHGDFAVTNAVDLPTYSEGIGGVTELFKNRIAIPFTGDYRDFRRVVHHELVHAVINDIFYGGSLQAIIQNNIQTRIPAWFNEGLAEYAALGWDTQSDMYVREAILEDHLAPIQFLGGYYAYRGGQSVWDYIAEQYGEEKIGEILQRLRLSRSVEGSIRRATGLSLKQLSERWQKSLREIYFPEVAAREDLDDIARAVITREQGFYNTSPALSPLGDKLAFITTTQGLFDIYLASANDGKIIRRLVEGQTSSEFESLRILTPGISWNPEGTHIAVAVKSGPSDVIAIIDVNTGETRRLPVSQVKQILAVAWSPDGDRVAFEGANESQSDIYILDINTRSVTNLTDDLFSDHQPSWSPDGGSLLFHSDRADYLSVGEARTTTYQMFDRTKLQQDLYILVIGSSRAIRITANEDWDETSGKFGPDGRKVLFISDRSGTYNLFEKDLDTQNVRPLTDLTVGVIQVSLSADGQRAAIVSLREGTPSIYILRTPFARTQELRQLRPNIWAQRVTQNSSIDAPALSLAGERLRRNNPFLRDASDGVQFARGRARLKPRVFDVDRLSVLIDEARRSRDGSIDTSSDYSVESGIDNLTLDDSDVVPAEYDSLYADTEIDFRDYRFSSAFENASEVSSQLFQTLPVRRQSRTSLDANGNYIPRRYKLNFSPDIVYGAAGYDALYGVQGVTQMMFSDMLGDHRIVVATNLLIDLRNSDYIISYNYLPRRLDWTFSTFHVSRLLADFQGSTPTYYRYRQYGSSLEASYPLDKFRRVDLEMAVIGVNQADVTDVTRPSQTQTLLTPRLTFTRDATTPGFMHPIAGSRLAVSVSGSALSFSDEQIRFVTFLGDARTYTSLARAGNYVFALRASGGVSLGPNKQLFYTSGVQNWINRRFDRVNGFPISDVSDFVFATPMMPLRGFDINARNGSNFALVNAEFRFPLVAALLPGPIPILPLYNIQGQAFIDAGSVWGGRGEDPRFNFVREDEEGRRRLDDLLVGTGLGLRTIFLGYPIRLDFAWPFDGQSFGDRRTYISIGLDF